MRFIAFDLETTGFLPGIDQIVEIGAVSYVNGKPDAVFATLINPGISMPEAASRVNGITDAMLVGQPTIDKILTSFTKFCGNDIIVAHNAPFDVQFLSADIQKHESPAPTGIILDTLPMARKVLPGLANYKLGTLVEHLQIDAAGFHRAEADAMYCAQVFWRIVQKISNGGEIPAVENLIALSNNAALKFPQITRQPKQLDMLSLI
jgi:DNA polymerase-3 subunit epsilon